MIASCVFLDFEDSSLPRKKEIMKMHLKEAAIEVLTTMLK